LFLKNNLIFPNVATDRTVRPGGPHGSRGLYVVRVWFRLSVRSVWACRTEEMTGIYGEIGGMEYIYVLPSNTTDFNNITNNCYTFKPWRTIIRH